VAAYLAPNSTQAPNDDYYSNCASYTAYCNAWFSSTGSDPGTCDTTCGFTPTVSYSGMAPGAKLMVYDFGDNSGNLDVPNNMRLKVYQPAYDANTHIFSSSWGAGAPYNYYDSQAVDIDQFMYDQDTTLVLFAAGNEGGDYGDDTYGNGDKTIGAPAVCKNVLTVGAAETAYTPDTVAYFSSRGPTPDNRLKPEVCGPGDPITSTKASGKNSMATCRTTTMSVR
jgi:hypothetical protein